MLHCKKDIVLIVRHYEDLLPEFRVELRTVFADLIRSLAQACNNSVQNDNVCYFVTLFRKACGNAAYHDIRKELSSTYSEPVQALQILFKSLFPFSF